MQMTYFDKIEAEGMKKGLEQGLEQGLEKGLEKGRLEGRLEGMRSLLGELIERRFGPISDRVEKRLLAIASAEELSRLHQRALEARDLDELRL